MGAQEFVRTDLVNVGVDNLGGETVAGSLRTFFGFSSHDLYARDMDA